MKRFLYPILWSSVFALLFTTLFVCQTRTHAAADLTVHLDRKVSKDILKKVTDGHGADFVRVIIEPPKTSDTTLDTTIEFSGGSTIGKLRNFSVRVATRTAKFLNL